jgi:phage-related protein
MAEGDLITADRQIEWRGLLLGADRIYGLRTLEGWVDLPSLRIGIEPRSGRHGAYSGQLLSDHRTVTVDLQVRGEGSEFTDAVRELRRVTASSENAPEEPLVIQWDGRKQMCMARCIRRMIPSEYSSYPMGLAPASVQWVASDPRLFELPAQLITTGLAVSVGELVFPLVFPLSFGIGGTQGTIQLTNTGNSDSWPTFVITGPVTAPSIVNNTNGRVLAFKSTTVIPAGQVWEVNTNHRTVTILGTNVSRNSELLVRQWFPIPAGETHFIKFSSSVYDVAAQLNALVYNTDL